MSSKKSRIRKQESSSDSDSGPEDRNPPQKKKQKSENKSAGGSAASGESSMLPLSKMRFISVREFRGKVMVDIREHYEADGDLRPGKKGICLSLDQWNALKGHIDSVDELIKKF